MAKVKTSKLIKAEIEYDLKPCPFCGHDRANLEYFYDIYIPHSGGECWVTCTYCGANTKRCGFGGGIFKNSIEQAESIAIDMWNRRAKK